MMVVPRSLEKDVEYVDVDTGQVVLKVRSGLIANSPGEILSVRMYEPQNVEGRSQIIFNDRFALCHRVYEVVTPQIDLYSVPFTDYVVFEDSDLDPVDLAPKVGRVISELPQLTIYVRLVKIPALEKRAVERAKQILSTKNTKFKVKDNLPVRGGPLHS